MNLGYSQPTQISHTSLPKTSLILNLRIDNTDYDDALSRILRWAEFGERRYVCIANVHMVMQAYKDDHFRQLVSNADIVTPDGMPLVWTIRFLGNKKQSRVYGPTLTLRICEGASTAGMPVGFYGGSPETLQSLVKYLNDRHPALRIAFTHSPPFRSIRSEEDESVIKEINKSGIKILFVGLGCPKQEYWMFNHLGKVNAVMIGVGAAFDFHAGTKKQAPNWMMTLGLEWLFRLCHEPRRLWKRYLYNNPRFLFLVARQILKERLLRNLGR